MRQSPDAAGPAVHTLVLSVVSSRQELQLMDNGLQPHTGEQSPIHGRKGGANGGLVIKKSESRTESRSDFFTPNKQFRRPCLDNYSFRKRVRAQM